MMSDLAPLLQSFFTDKLDRHMNASIHTKAAYADAFRLLLIYAQRATGVAPSALTVADLNADLDGRVPAAPADRPRKLRRDPQRPTGCVAILLHLRQLPGTGLDRHDQPGPRDPREAHEEDARVVPHRPRSRSAHRCPGHEHLDRAT